MIKKASDKHNDNLYDGFQEIFSFSNHKLQIRGFTKVDVGEDKRMSSDKKKDTFLSWDSKQMYLWEYGSLDCSPRTIAHMKFPNNQSDFISSAVFVTNLKILVAAALDMTFRIYDKKFNFLEAIHHQERSLLHMEYIQSKGVIVMSSALGVSVWRIFRNTALSTAHIMEKLFIFDGCSGWVTKMSYEPYSDYVYAFVDDVINVIDFEKRRVVSRLSSIHEAPVTNICWYARSQFFITSCSQGQVKCWTSHFHHSKVQSQKSQSGVNCNFALLHTFFAHTRAITGLVLHPVSGLAISSSLDGLIKVLNLENLTELFSVENDAPIQRMEIIQFGPQLSKGCIFYQDDGAFKLWKITSCCNFFGVSTTILKSIHLFDNFHVDMNDDQYQGHRQYVVGYASHDLRIFSPRCQLLSHLEPQAVVDGIISFTASVYQQLLFALLESGVIRVYCTRSAVCEFVADVALQTKMDIKGGTILSIVDFLPSAAIRPSGRMLATKVYDMRNEEIPGNISELIVLGTQNGSLFMLDTLDNCNVTFVTQIHFGPIIDIKYRKSLNELFVFAKDILTNTFCIRIVSIPSMEVKNDLNNLRNVSCFNIALSSSLFGIGCDDGYVRLFNAVDESKMCAEVIAQSTSHDDKVLCLTFCDNLKVYATCSMDSHVMVWDYEKRLIKNIKFHMPTYEIYFLGNLGDILITQGYYLLTITKKIWDEGDVLEYLRTYRDPWLDSIQTLGAKRSESISQSHDKIGISTDSLQQLSLDDDASPSLQYLSLSLEQDKTFVTSRPPSSPNQDNNIPDNINVFRNQIQTKVVSNALMSSEDDMIDPLSPSIVVEPALSPVISVQKQPSILPNVNMGSYVNNVIESVVNFGSSKLVSKKVLETQYGTEKCLKLSVAQPCFQTRNQQYDTFLSPRARLTLLYSSNRNVDEENYCISNDMEAKIVQGLQQVLAPSAIFDGYLAAKIDRKKERGAQERLLNSYNTSFCSQTRSNPSSRASSRASSRPSTKSQSRPSSRGVSYVIPTSSSKTPSRISTPKCSDTTEALNEPLVIPSMTTDSTVRVESEVEVSDSSITEEATSLSSTPSSSIVKTDDDDDEDRTRSNASNRAVHQARGSRVSILDNGALFSAISSRPSMSKRLKRNSIMIHKNDENE